MSFVFDKYKRKGITITLPFKHVLTEDQKERLEDNLNVVEYRKKDVIFRQTARASNFTFIASGMVKIYKQGRNNRSTILKLAKDGDCIGLMSTFGDDVHQYSAAALSDCVICDLDFMLMKSILLENGKLSYELLNLISLDALTIFEKLVGQSQKQLPGRVADVLLYFSEKVFNSDTFTLPFSRKELAEFSGTTKESFIRTLTEFKNDKIIEINGAEVSIKSMDIVRTLSHLG